MGSNRLAFLIIGLAAIGAAGGGAYLALRDGAAPAALAPTVETEAPIEGATVSETEAVVDDEAAAARPATVEPAVPPPPAPRREPPPAVRPARPTRAPAVVARPTPTRDTAQERPAPVVAPAADPVVEEPPPAPSVAVAEPAPELAPLPVEAPPAEPVKQVEQLVVAADSVIGLQLETTVTTERAKLEDPVEARVTRDVLVGNAVAIPAGSRVLGSVTIAERGGKMKQRARLGVRFHTLVLADGTRTDLPTETLIREGAPPSGESAAKIGGGAIGGAILGAILGGGKGAAIGGAAGAGAGTAAVMAGGRNAAELREGSTVTVRLTAPATVTIEQ
jgi:hypothetical protein